MEFKKLYMTNSAGFEIDSIYPVHQEKGILYKVFPFLQELRDKDGLVPMSDLSEKFDFFDGFLINMGYLKSKDTPYTIMFHQYFRRSYNAFNNFNPYIVNLLGDLYINDKIPDFLIALDEDSIMQTKDWHQYHEREYWYGPKFNHNIPHNKQEVTKYTSSFIEKCANGSAFTEYYWKQKKDGSFQLEIEELTEIEHPNIEQSFGCRYIHSLYDKDNESFNHIDGSTRIYDSNQYQSRFYNSIDNYPNRNAKYKKLFRVDGKLSLDIWKTIIQGYLYHNESVNQYFNED